MQEHVHVQTHTHSHSHSLCVSLCVVCVDIYIAQLLWSKFYACSLLIETGNNLCFAISYDEAFQEGIQELISGRVHVKKICTSTFFS